MCLCLELCRSFAENILMPIQKFLRVLSVVFLLPYFSDGQVQTPQMGAMYPGMQQETTEQRFKALEGVLKQPLCSWESEPKAKAQCLQGYMSGTGYNPQQTCETARQNYTTTRGKFISACSKAGMTGGGRTGNIGCSAKVLNCSSCSGDGDGGDGRLECKEADMGDVSEDGSDIADRMVAGMNGNIAGTVRSDMQVAPNRATAQEKYRYCPDLAKDDLSAYTKEVEEAKKNVNDLKDKLSKAQQDNQDLQTKFQAQMDALDQEAEAKQQQAKDDVEKLRDQLTEDQQKIADDVTKMENQISALIAKKDEEIIARQMNSQKLNELQATADLNCHDQALKKVNELRTQRLAQMEASQYSAGTFNSLLKGVGLDTRQKSQILAQQYHNWCIQDMSYKRLISNGQQKFNIDNNASIQRVVNIDRQIQFYRTQITNLRTTRLNQISQTTLNRMQRVQDKMNTDLNNISKKKFRLQEEYNKKIVAKTQDLNRLQTQVTQEQNYLSQKQTYLSVRNLYAKGDSIPAGSFYEASNQMEELIGAIPQFVTACCGAQNTGDCSAARSFYCQTYSGLKPGDSCLGGKTPDSTGLDRAPGSVN